MRIRYKASPDDLVAFVQFHYKHYSPARRKDIILGILVPIVFFILFCIDGVRKERWDMPIVGAVFAGAVMFWLLGGHRQRLEKTVRKMLKGGSNKVCFGEHELEITETGLIERSQHEEDKFSWDIIEQVGFTADYTFIFIGAARGVSIAKSSVLEGVYEEFVEELRQRFEEKLRTESVQQEDDFGKRVITDTARIYKGDADFGRHSWCGITSFVIAAATLLLDILLFVSMVIMRAIIPEIAQGNSVMLHIFAAVVMAGGFANIIGVVLGVVGACQKNRKKTFAFWGLAMNLIAVIVLARFIAIGRATS